MLKKRRGIQVGILTATVAACMLVGLALLARSTSAAHLGTGAGVSAGKTSVPATCGQFDIVPSANQGGGLNSLNAVLALSSEDVWVVGGYYDSSFSSQTLVEHWNGTAWSIVPSPNPGSSSGNTLRGISGLASNDLWAVGDGYIVGGNHLTIVEHWNGTAWSIVPSPNPSSYNVLNGVSALASNDVWVVGYEDVDVNLHNTLVEHWDGTAWSIIPSANFGGYNVLSGISALPGDDVWAVGVGTLDSSGIPQTLAEHYGGSCGTATPVLTATPTSPSVGTPTPTAIAGDFIDVPRGSAFYPYVECLFQRSIISGYTDHSFRPSSPVTRGQISKIVAGAAAYSDPPDTQTFEDVAPGTTFYPYIQQLASRGVISGYTCGGAAGEPCVAPSNRPYFRPNDTASRGQTSKIVAISAGLPAPPPGRQSFQDVPVGSTFWSWVEALSAVEAVSGYTCGAMGEPCVAPANKPYFRPGNLVTRGQSAKIVANAFLPGCQQAAR